MEGDLRKLTAIGLAMATALGAAPAAAQAPGQVFVDISTHLAIDDKCKILPPVERLALELTRDEVRPAVSTTDMALIDQRMTQVKTILAQKPCTDPEIAPARGPILEAGGYYQALWSARVLTAGNLRMGTMWATWSPVTGIKRSAAERRLATWGAAHQGGDKQVLATIRPEATRMMTVACPSRSSSMGQCPVPTPPAAPGEAEAAKVWGERVDKFAASLGGARLDGEPVLPEGATSWDQVFTVLPLDIALVPGLPLQDCKAGTTAVVVTGNKAVLYSTHDGFPIGEGEVLQMGAIQTISSPQLGRGMEQSFGLIGCKTP